VIQVKSKVTELSVQLETLQTAEQSRADKPVNSTPQSSATSFVVTSVKAGCGFQVNIVKLRDVIFRNVPTFFFSFSFSLGSFAKIHLLDSI